MSGQTSMARLPSLGTNSYLLIRYMSSKLQANGKKTSPVITLQMLGFFRIYWANLPAICWVQQTLGFFLIYWVMWLLFPHQVNLKKTWSNLITIYWAIRSKGFFAIYLISLFIICWVQQMPSFFAVYWVMWSQFTDYVNLKKTRNLLR